MESQTPMLQVLPAEVLILVFKHLGQEILRHNVNLVCKHWKIVSDGLIRRLGVWRSMKDQDHQDLLRRMPKLDALRCQFQWYRTPSDLVAWYNFTRTVLAPLPVDVLQGAVFPDGEDIDRRTQKRESSLPRRQCILHLMEELDLRHMTFKYGAVIPRLLPGMTFLRILSIRHPLDPIPVLLFPILKACPFLEVLTLQKVCSLLPGDEHDDIHDHPSDNISGQCSDPVGTKAKERYRLLEIQLVGMGMDVKLLDRILETCPGLRVLRWPMLYKISFNQRKGGEDHVPLSPRELEVLLVKVKQLCPDLDPSALSTAFSNFYEKDHARWIELHQPKAGRLQDHRHHGARPVSSLTLIHPGPGRFSYNHLFTHRTMSTYHYLTRLEVIKDIGIGTEDLNNLLAFTPNLLELIAPSVRVDTVNLYEEGAYYSSNRHFASAAEGAPLPLVPRIWACRELRKLEIGLASESSEYDAHEARFCRYLARYCPRIRCLRLLVQILYLGAGRWNDGGCLKPCGRHVGSASNLPIFPFNQLTSPQARIEEEKCQFRSREPNAQVRRIDWWALYLLKDLEVLHLRAREGIPGVIAITADTFRFLALKKNSVDSSPPPSLSASSPEHSLPTSLCYEWDEADFWPNLTSFQIWDDSVRVPPFPAEVQAWRPHVEFRLQHEHYPDWEFW